MSRVERLWLGLMLMLAAPMLALASGPRYVTGPPFYTGYQGIPVRWAQSNLKYYTDPGALSTAVNHSAADALVAAAAGVWNLPVASITVSKGGTLAEHVSSANVYLGTSGMVFPDDVSSANASAVPIAVIYDADGSVTDLLLGRGASDPSGCRQNAVTESVDQFDPAGYILHALIVINGRCTGTAPEMQLQVQYQLERVFGRVLGLAWSQANDNVFTGTPTPTYQQALHWPIMHPLDVICGPYTYQCLPSPFQLRPDDIASMVLVYPNPVGQQPPAGKQVSLDQAVGVYGTVLFPAGQAMAGVNVIAQRQSSQTGALEPWVEASAVTGTKYRRNLRSAFVVADTSERASEGSMDPGWLGNYYIAYVPLQDGTTQQSMVDSTEAVNPLYVGTHSVEPYAAGAVAPSGTMPQTVTQGQATHNGDSYGFFTVADAAATCGAGLDGTAAAPAQVAATGWWNGQICPHGHISYLNVTVRPNRSLTVEVTGLDEQGFATTHKMMPTIGIYAQTDHPSWDLPSLAVAPTAFQALGLGTTTVSAATGTMTQMTIGIADQRQDGRPDFAFQGRVFYANSVSPERLPADGGTVTISGMGFRLGNQVKVNGVTAAVTSWTSTAIVVTMPTMTAAGATDKTAVDVVIADISSGARSTMTGALTYDTSSTLPNSMKLVSAQQASADVGNVAPAAFSVQVVGGDGKTPVAGESVVFSVAGNMGQWAACGAATCTVTTDAGGMASTGITPLQAGTVTMQAVDGTLKQTATFTAIQGDPGLTMMSAPSGNLATSTQAAVPFAVKVVAADGTTGLPGRVVTFTVPAGSAIFSGCLQATCSVTTAADGTAGVFVTPTKSGPVRLQAVDGSLKRGASFTAVDTPDLMQVARTPASSLAVGSTTPFGILLLRSDGATPDPYQAVTFAVSGGAVLNPCNAATCMVNTAADGTATVSVGSVSAGTFTILATFGQVAQTASVTFTVSSGHMTVLSAPTGMQRVGVAADTPFSVRVVGADGSPLASSRMALNGPTNQVSLGACGGVAGCIANTDGNGVLTTTVTPLRAGPIVVTAQYTTLNQTITFNASGGSKTINVLSVPGVGTHVGDVALFQVQVIGADGVTPAAGDYVELLVTTGSFAFAGWSTAYANAATDAQGRVTGYGVANAPGPVTIQVTDGAVSATVSFTVAARTELMQTVSAPSGNVAVGTAATPPFAVQVLQADGVTPIAGRAVTFAIAAGNATLSACATPPCVMTTDANGMAAVTMTPQAAGTSTVSASSGGVTLSASVNGVVQQDVLKLVSAPEASATVGTQETTPFAVRAFQSDGTTPAVGKNVVFSTMAGAVEFGVCGAATCTVTTGSDGGASTTVTPVSAGVVTLLATEGSQTVTAQVNAVAKPDRIAVVSAPGTSVLVGATAGSAFGVKVTLADGTTPVAGMNVSFSNGGTGAGAVQFIACGAAICAVSTDTDGVAATNVAGVTAGAATLVATVNPSTGAQSVSVPLQVVSDQESVNAANPATYLAEGTTFTTALQVTATQNGAPGAGAAVIWAGGAGIALAGASSTADGAGVARMQATMGPLAAGGVASATGCAWSSACATFTATGVSSANLLIALTSGGAQAATGGAVAPVVAGVRDTEGHVIAGAQVTVYQTVTAAAVACPAKGRCPAAPVLTTKVSTLSTDSNGVVSVVPVTLSGTATETKLLLTVGTRGTATAEVWNTP